MGHIVADFIDTGILTADIIKTGILESKNGKSWLNMSTGEFNFGDKVKYEDGKFEIIVESSDGGNTSLGNELNNMDNKIDSIKNEAINSANNTLTTTISNYYTKSETDSKISVAKNEINLGVSNTYETKTNVETKVTSTLNSAKSYADTKKTEAINTASTDATNKVNSAKTELNTAIGKKANSVDVYTKSEVYTKAQTDSAIKVAKDEINLGVSSTYETKTNVASQVTSTLNSAKSYADTKKSEAISSASSDATTKANNALTSAKSYTDTAKNALNTEIGKKANSTDVYTKTQTYTKTEVDSAIKLSKDTIELGVSQKYETKEEVTNKVTTAIGNIQVGGKNLIKNSKKILLNGSDNGNWNCSVIENDYVKITPKNNGNVYNTGVQTYETRLKGVTYTLSFDVLTSTKIGFYWYPSEKYTKAGYIESSDKWQRISFTYTQTGGDQSNATLFGFLDLIGGQVYKYKNLQLEVGNKATQWSPAPEDVDTSITTAETNAITESKNYTDSQIKISKDAIELGISQKYETKSNVTSQVSTALTSAKSYADTKKSEAISAASSDATTKANNALTSAKSYADTKKSEAIASANNTLNTTITNYYTKTQTDSAIKLAKDSVTTQVGKVEEIASSSLQGKMLYTDPTFESGSNSMNIYNNAANGTVTVTRITKSSDCPTTSGYMIQIKTTGAASPGHGGFYFGTQTRNNAIFVTKIIAKIPTNYTLVFATNSIGTGGSHKWLTDNKGTGNWKEYIYKVTCGNGGTLSSTNFFYVSGGSTATTSAPVTWYVAMATTFDITATDNIEKRMNTAESKITDTAITNVVKQNFYTKSETDGQITSKGYQTSSQVQQTVDALQLKFTQSGGYNLLRNGKASLDTKHWVSNGGGISRTTDVVYGTCFKTSLPGGIKYNGGSSGSSSAIRLKNNTHYVYEATIYSRTALPGTKVSPLHFWCGTSPSTGGIGQCSIVDYRQAVPTVNKWTKCYVHILTASSGEVWFTPFIYTGGSYTGDILVTEISLSESSVETPYSPHASEIYDGVTTIDKDGVTVKSSNGAYTNFNSVGMNSFNNSGQQTLGIRNGGITFHPYSSNQLGAYITQSALHGNSAAANGLAISTANNGTYIALGTSSLSDANTTLNMEQALTVSANDNFQPKGINLWKDTHAHGYGIRQLSHLRLAGSGAIQFDYLNTSPSTIYEAVDGGHSLYVMGGYQTHIGCMDGKGIPKGVIWMQNSTNTHSYTHWDFHNYTMYNMKTASTYANYNTGRIGESYGVTSNIDGVRYLYKNVELVDGKAIRSIPLEYKGCEYDIVSIVCKGRGSAWVETEDENRFEINGECKSVNVEIIIYPSEAVMTASTQQLEEAPTLELPKETEPEEASLITNEAIYVR